MATRTTITSALALAFCCGPTALAETAAHDDPPGCFDVVAIPSKALETGSILVNRCSGDTWLLMTDRTPAQGGAVYHWHQIRRVSEEAMVVSPGNKATAR